MDRQGAVGVETPSHTDTGHQRFAPEEAGRHSIAPDVDCLTRRCGQPTRVLLSLNVRLPSSFSALSLEAPRCAVLRRESLSCKGRLRETLLTPSYSNPHGELKVILYFPRTLLCCTSEAFQGKWHSFLEGGLLPHIRFLALSKTGSAEDTATSCSSLWRNDAARTSLREVVNRQAQRAKRASQSIIKRPINAATP